MTSQGDHEKDEHVTAIADTMHPDRFVPQITNSNSQDAPRPFEAEDICRVLDFQGLSCDTPKDGRLMYGEVDGSKDLQFPHYYFCLRGGFLFYFEIEDVDTESGPVSYFHAPPKGVIPLQNISIALPPGGRRVFREHTSTDARNGYEFVILSVVSDGHPDANHNDKDEREITRTPTFIVAESLGHREKWAKSLRERSGIVKPTVLRRGYAAPARELTARKGYEGAIATTIATATNPNDNEDTVAVELTSNNISTASSSIKVGTAIGSAEVTTAVLEVVTKEKKDKTRQRREYIIGNSSKLSSLSGASTTDAGDVFLDVKDDAELNHAIADFGRVTFSEKDWMDAYFASHNDFDVPTTCRQLESFQIDMKKSVKGAVLEQYIYFVQASGEMSAMGREIAALKSLIETQLETLKSMKDVDFYGCVTNRFLGSNKEEEGDEMESPRLNELKKDERSYQSEIDSYISSRRHHPSGFEPAPSVDVNENLDAEFQMQHPLIRIPEWLEDVTTDIPALVREGQYVEAIELLLKAKSEVVELIEKHERPTLYKLTQKQRNDLKVLHKSLEDLRKRTSSRLEETLRRKNEALRHATKRDRSELHHSSVTVVSPCALRDDALYLQLLVKLGYTQIAADAYSTRRSLLLLESLNERPISGTESVDIVIYSAQLSQSFFSCLAYAVEGFLDLFMGGALTYSDKQPEDNDSLADSSVTSSQGLKSSSTPSGAVASVVLWCDAELSKFAITFGGNRVLAKLALSPPPRRGDEGVRRPRIVGAVGGDATTDRLHAVSVAAQCIDQAFLYATQNLDSVGLPLAPRLAEYIRERLKGCEDEVAQLLDERWHHLTIDWRSPKGIHTNGNGSYRIK